MGGVLELDFKLPQVCFLVVGSLFELGLVRLCKPGNLTVLFLQKVTILFVFFEKLCLQNLHSLVELFQILDLGLEGRNLTILVLPWKESNGVTKNM